jgi:hypothetical protein
MGLLDFFMSEEKKIQRHTRRLTNRDAQPEDREASVVWLAKHGTPEAIAGLISRFDMNLDHQLKDAGEKEILYQVLLELGQEKVEAPLRTWLKRCKQFALPMRLFGDLFGEAAALETALELLDIEHKKDDFKPEKKRNLLIWLTDQKDDRLLDAATPFLKDFDEGVRYSAAEVILAQGDPRGAGPLSALVSNPEEDSNRLRVRVAEGLVQRRWDCASHGLTEDGLPDGFALRDGRVVRKS